jgi:two-component system, response regulator PdtaR
VVPLQSYGVAARRTILVVEDEVLLRMFIADELRSAGYNVLEAFDAGEALDLLSFRPVQLLFSDIRMPGPMNGIELARAIRSRYPEIKVVLTSAESFSAGHRTEYDGFFPKPCDTKRLIEHIKMLLGEEHTHDRCDR